MTWPENGQPLPVPPPAPPAPPPGAQATSTAMLLTVLLHGLPKTSLLAGTVQLWRPTQVALTTSTESVALQAPAVNAPQLPAGVP